MLAVSDEIFRNMSYFCGNGEMAEWSNAAVLKTVVRSRGPGVRIPLSPQNPIIPRLGAVFLFVAARAKRRRNPAHYSG